MRDVRVRRAACVCALALCATCDNVVGPGGQSRCEQDNAPLLHIGGSVETEYRGELAVACVTLTARDTVDFGVFIGQAALANPRLETVDETVLAIPATPAARFSSVDGLDLIYARLVASSSGVAYFYLRSDRPCHHSGCVPSGPFTLRVRRSAPLILMQCSGDLGGNGALLYRRAQGTPVHDTILVRNVGNGTATVAITSRTSLASLSGAASIAAGPSTGWTPDEGAKAAFVDIAGRAPGFYDDTLIIAGIPSDEWHARAPRSIVLRARFDEPASRMVQLAPGPHIYQFAVSPTGEIVGAGWKDTLYSVNQETGELAPWGPLINGGIGGESESFDFGPDSALYYRGSAPTATGATRKLFRVKPPGGPELLTDFTVTMFAVLPDLTIYMNDGTSIRRRSPDGTLQSIGSFSPTYRPAMYFNRADSTLYYGDWNYWPEGTPGVVVRRDLKTGQTTSMQTSGSLRAVDRVGRVYIAEQVAFNGDISLGNRLLILDKAGGFVARRYPPGNVDGFGIARDSLFGYDSGRRLMWVIPVTP